MKRHRYLAGLAALLVILLLAPAAAAQTGSDTPSTADWYARYWNNVEMSGAPVLARNETLVNYRWRTGSPAPGVRADRFSARWTATVHFEPGAYRFTTVSDDGIRVWLQDEWIIDNWDVHPEAEDTAVRYLDGDYAIQVDYFEDTGEATAIVLWERVGGGPAVTISPTRGPVGTRITVEASGFAPGATVTVGLGRAQSEPATSHTVTASPNGEVSTTVTVPSTASVGAPWVVLVSSDGQSALSPRFIVTSGGATAPSTCGPVYTVQPGDWLSRIARACNTTVEAIVAANPTLENPSLIYPGRQLNMPGYQAGAPRPQVVVDRLSAAPGTTLRVYAAGLAPLTEVVIGLGVADSEAAFTTSVTTNANGELSTGLTLPPEAEVGEEWVAFVRLSPNETLTSTPVTVTARGAGLVTPLYNLRLREGPGTQTERLDVVPAGTTLEVRAFDSTGDWVQVEYRGQIGWLAAWLAEFDGEAPASPNE